MNNQEIQETQSNFNSVENSTSTHAETDDASHWAVVELMGHVRLGGKVSEQQFGGTTFIRLDVPTGQGFATKFLGPSSVYAIHFVDEFTARCAATNAANKPPVYDWEYLSALASVGKTVVSQQSLPESVDSENPFDTA